MIRGIYMERLGMTGSYRRRRACVAELKEDLKELVITLIENFIAYLPEKSRRLKLEDVRKHLNETWFIWIGGWGESNPFCFRIQSLVIVIKFDHHSGVFLTNKEPMKFHIHSIVRTPNGGDYSNDLREDEDKLE